MNLDEAVKLYAPDGIILLWSRDRHIMREKILSVPFDPDLHYPICWINLHYATMAEAQHYLDAFPDKEDETHIELQDYLLALKECQRTNHSVFPLSIPYRDWWNGPHLFQKEGVTEWYPLRVEYIEGTEFGVTLAFLEEGSIHYYYATYPLSDCDTTPIERDFGEIVCYGEKYKFKFYDICKAMLPTPLLRLKEITKPYIARSNELLFARLENDLPDNDY